MKKKNTHKKEKLQRRATAAARQLGIWETAVAASRSCCIFVRMLPDLCPHAARYVPSCCQICVLVLLYMCPHAARYVSACCYVCPHAARYVSSYFFETVVIGSRRLGGGLLWTFRPLVSELFSVCVCVLLCVCTLRFLRVCVCLCVCVFVYLCLCVSRA
jgi:hypothetical protein